MGGICAAARAHRTHQPLTRFCFQAQNGAGAADSAVARQDEQRSYAFEDETVEAVPQAARQGTDAAMALRYGLTRMGWRSLFCGKRPS